MDNISTELQNVLDLTDAFMKPDENGVTNFDGAGEIREATERLSDEDKSQLSSILRNQFKSAKKLGRS